MAHTKRVREDIPPYPLLVWNEFFWTGTIQLPAWKGFQCRAGSYGAVSSRKPSVGKCTLTIRPPVREGETPPSSEQTVAYRYLVHHQEAIRDAILARVFDEYPDYRAGHAELFGDDSDVTLPAIKRPAQLRNLIGLHNVLIQDVFHEGAAYVGYEFGCAWDEEHGLGVMMHQGRIVDLGGADTAILEWIAERDAKENREKSVGDKGKRNPRNRKGR